MGASGRDHLIESGGGPRPASILYTKLHPPVIDRLMVRDQLIQTLRVRQGTKLTLVCAPAGWGKSSLLATWAAADDQRRPFAWFAIDDADNNPVRFWTYLIEALRTVEPSIGSVSLPLLHQAGTGRIDRVIPELINEIGAVGNPVVLAIDDYHLINEHEIHADLAFFVEYQPAMLHIAIATRVEPCLPVAKLRASGELIEIDAAVLGFSDEEADRYLNQVLSLGLTGPAVASLRERTEGWAAGLHLAGLSLYGQDDQHEFIAQLTGDDRHIADYLRAEVLTLQDEDLRTFLRRTSILDRLCAPLCDAVTGIDSSGDRLREMEQSNLFLVPLDSKRDWYRYHYLFRDLLRRELDAEDGGLVADLHRCAAQWFLDAGHISEAIRHITVAGDFDQAGDLVATHWADFLRVGDVGTVVSWLEALPDDTLSNDARVCVAGALVSLTTNRLEEVEGWIEKAELAASPGPFLDGYGSLAAATRYIRGWHRLSTGALRESRTVIMETLSLLAESSPWRSISFFALGFSSYLLGETREGFSALEESLRLGQIQDARLDVTLTLGGLASVRADMGQWEEAADLVWQALEMCSASTSGEHWTHGFSYFTRGRILERNGEFEAADVELGRGAELIRGGFRFFLAYLLPSYASFKNARGDRDEGRKMLLEARKIVDGCPDPGILPQLVEKVERRFRLVPSCPAAPFVEELSARELSVLRLLMSTLSQRQLADKLGVSMNTIKSHTKSIFRKLGVSTRAQAVAKARTLGLI